MKPPTPSAKTVREIVEELQQEHYPADGDARLHAHLAHCYPSPRDSDSGCQNN